MLTVSDLIKVHAAEFTAGDAIAIIAGKHVVLARNTADGLVFTDEGRALAAATNPLDRDASGEPGGSRKGRRARKGEQAAAGDVSTETGDAGEDPPAGDEGGDQLQLGLDDALEIGERVG
jgi:hypothetical protein